MSFAGFEINPRHTDPWVTAIGKFMVNFGGVEWTTFLWIDRLSDDVVLKELTIEMPLSRRIDVVKKLLERRDLPKKFLQDSKSAWGRAEKLAKLRNDLAHNPVVFGWHGSEEQRAPDFIGSLNFRKAKAGVPRATPILELAALNRGVDEAAAVAQKLHTILESLQAPSSDA
jgi:hypothetical protein